MTNAVKESLSPCLEWQEIFPEEAAITIFTKASPTPEFFVRFIPVLKLRSKMRGSTSEGMSGNRQGVTLWFSMPSLTNSRYDKGEGGYFEFDLLV